MSVSCSLQSIPAGLPSDACFCCFWRGACVLLRSSLLAFKGRQRDTNHFGGFAMLRDTLPPTSMAFEQGSLQEETDLFGSLLQVLCLFWHPRGSRCTLALDGEAPAFFFFSPSPSGGQTAAGSWGWPWFLFFPDGCVNFEAWWKPKGSGRRFFGPNPCFHKCPDLCQFQFVSQWAAPPHLPPFMGEGVRFNLKLAQKGTLKNKSAPLSVSVRVSLCLCVCVCVCVCGQVASSFPARSGSRWTLQRRLTINRLP